MYFSPVPRVHLPRLFQIIVCLNTPDSHDWVVIRLIVRIRCVGANLQDSDLTARIVILKNSFLNLFHNGHLVLQGEFLAGGQCVCVCRIDSK